jgi:hypothetical protein
MAVTWFGHFPFLVRLVMPGLNDALILRWSGFDTYVRNLNVYLHNLRVEEEVRIPVIDMHIHVLLTVAF